MRPAHLHRVPRQLLHDSIRIVVVGCGGTGSAMATGLPHLHKSLLALGHPRGIDVTLVDDEVVTQTNCVRQMFSESEIGVSKAVALTSRINAFWNLRWTAMPTRLLPDTQLGATDIVIGCVDTREARKAIKQAVGRSSVYYWLDLGNNASDGQWVLGEPVNKRHRKRLRARLRTVAELYPETINPKLDDPTEPACSDVEALTRQEPFVNQTLAYHALAALSYLLRHGELRYHGAFLNFATGSTSRLPVGRAA